MELTPEQLGPAGEFVTTVRNGALRVIAETPGPEGIDDATTVYLSVDGLVAAAAHFAELTGILPNRRERKRFAEELAKAFLEHMDDARASQANVDLGGGARPN